MCRCSILILIVTRDKYTRSLHTIDDRQVWLDLVEYVFETATC